MCLANAKATVLTDIDLIMADINKMPGGRAGMEQKLKKYLHECLWVYIHPAEAVTPQRALKRARHQPEVVPVPAVQADPDLSHRTEQLRAEIEGHHAWARGLAAQLEQTEAMSEEQQDEGTRRGSDLRSMASDEDTVRELLASALRAYDDLDLLEADSSDEEEGGYDFGSGEEAGDQELASELQRTLSAERAS